MIPSVSLLPLLLLLPQSINAAPHDTDKLVRRVDDASTTPTPTAWVSVVDDGSVTTVTPSVKTDSSGNPTETVNPKPSETGSSDSSGQNGDVIASCDSSKYELEKTGNVQPWIPFCAPHNGTDWWVGGNYYVTWNPKHWARNSSVKIILNYANAGGAGKVAKSWETANSFGLINIEPSKDWLVNQTALSDGDKKNVENQTMYFTIADDSPSDTLANVVVGPTIILTSRPSPAPVDKSPSNRPPVSTLGLAVGLPLVFVFVVGTVIFLHFCMKSKRTVGPVSIGGGRRHFSKRGYSGRAVRRQRAAVAVRSGEYRDELEEEIAPAGGVPPKRGEWELTSVQGGR
ncbi:hypothetical protein L873DRAFT_1691367 [Choiromyces venosus 120613-1]|uniref:Mid2 domain-containing protein n=1 Tax=Choiromyces venosus 120613-1 TaxID=1336337 RepID=A0A3N4JJ20_9PEZI|nr:hypothetical protein L873DRAFT_1691367 [Choiromyces venosus 120613-1]